MAKESPFEGLFETVKDISLSRDREAYEDFKKGMDAPGEYGVFMSHMALQSLIEEEVWIIRVEWWLDDPKITKKDAKIFEEDLEYHKEQFVQMRKELKEKLGERFESMMEVARKDHNDCARSNLDNNDGKMYCFVLPEFEDDGSHGPVGEKDVPWNVEERG